MEPILWSGAPILRNLHRLERHQGADSELWRGASRRRCLSLGWVRLEEVKPFRFERNQRQHASYRGNLATLSLTKMSSESAWRYIVFGMG